MDKNKHKRNWLVNPNKLAVNIRREIKEAIYTMDKLYWSLNEREDDRKFNDIYLKNLKIWQLKTMVKYSCKAEQIKQKLSYKLELPKSAPHCALNEAELSFFHIKFF